MAEFMDVIRSKRRMCEYYKGLCTGCPLEEKHCGVISNLCASDDACKAIEDVVTAWAAEHPEPVYPTWLEWFANRGEYQEADDANINIAACVSILLSRIPADIGEKLGIEPKEGTA